MDKYIDIDGVKLHYTESGDTSMPVLVLMHGWGCNTSTLASIENAVQDLCHVYNIDFPGFGQSAEPSTVWGVEEYTRLVEKWLKSMGVEVPMLLGHSFGGRVGILYSSRNPVSRLILVDAAGIKPRRTLKYYFKVYSFKIMKWLAPILLGKKSGQEWIERRRAKSGSSDYNNSTPMMRAILSRVVNEDLKKVMPKIEAPTLLIWGEKDTATPLSDAKTMERLIPGSGLVSFPGCSHYSFLDNPIQFKAVLRSFVTS